MTKKENLIATHLNKKVAIVFQGGLTIHGELRKRGDDFHLFAKSEFNQQAGAMMPEQEQFFDPNDIFVLIIPKDGEKPTKSKILG